MYSFRLLSVSVALIATAASTPLAAQYSFLNPNLTEGPIDVATDDFGNSSIQLALDLDQRPVISFGESGHLYVATWDDALEAFAEPILVSGSDGVYLSDQDGHSMVSIRPSGSDTLQLSYHISGQWANGARSSRSIDGGLTWSEPVEMVPSTTTVDHFMPRMGLDPAGRPFAGMKVGSGSGNVYEGVMLSEDDGMTWPPVVDAGTEIPGGSVCECCPSELFYASGGYHNLVRINDNNLRDIWLLSSESDMSWTHALDVDPLDWMISSCPATGATQATFAANGTHLAAFKAEDSEGNSRVYFSEFILPVADSPGSYEATAPATWQDESGVQNFPSLASTTWSSGSGQLTACAWEQNSGGYDIQLMLSDATDISGFTDIAVNLTEDMGGQHRKPRIALCENDGQAILHLAWKSTMSGTVKYLRGQVDWTQSVANESLAATPGLMFHADGQVQVTIPANWGDGTLGVWSIAGQQITSHEIHQAREMNLQLRPGIPVLIGISKADGSPGWAKKILPR